MYCNRAPPAILEARNNFPISAGKTVWILHPQHVDIPVGAGKTGLSWNCKSSKLGQQCTEGMQYVFDHRVFEQSTLLMYPSSDDAELRRRRQVFDICVDPNTWTAKGCEVGLSLLGGLHSASLISLSRQTQPCRTETVLCRPVRGFQSCCGSSL